MSKLTIGQRIDVYEVLNSDYVAAKGKDIGNQYIANKHRALYFIPLSHDWDWERFGLNYHYSRTKKVGTFIVKSLKGGNG